VNDGRFDTWIQTILLKPRGPTRQKFEAVEYRDVIKSSYVLDDRNRGILDLFCKCISCFRDGRLVHRELECFPTATINKLPFESQSIAVAVLDGMIESLELGGDVWVVDTMLHVFELYLSKTDIYFVWEIIQMN